MAQLIIDFNIGWYLGDIEINSDNKKTIGSKKEGGKIQVRTDESNGFVEIPISSFTEFVTITTLLNGRKPVYFDSDKRYIGTVDLDN